MNYFNVLRMLNVIFLTTEIAKSIHEQQIHVYGGKQGIRDEGLLASAIGQAEHAYYYTNDIDQVAAQYGISIIQNHPFIDGNKRTGIACLLTFLTLNHLPLTYTSEQLFSWTLQIAQKQIDRVQFAKQLKYYRME